MTTSDEIVAKARERMEKVFKQLEDELWLMLEVNVHRSSDLQERWIQRDSKP